jgi:hypothetical protein
MASSEDLGFPSVGEELLQIGGGKMEMGALVYHVLGLKLPARVRVDSFDLQAPYLPSAVVLNLVLKAASALDVYTALLAESRPVAVGIPRASPTSDTTSSTSSRLSLLWDEYLPKDRASPTNSTTSVTSAQSMLDLLMSVRSPPRARHTRDDTREEDEDGGDDEDCSAGYYDPVTGMPRMSASV